MSNLFHTKTKVTRTQREEKLKQRALLIWFTGLSGSGKSTLAVNLEALLADGDNMRMGLNKDLGFDDEGRIENIRRIGEVSKLFIDAGTIVLSAFISPFESDRELVKQTVGPENFVGVFVDCPLEVCEKRDAKGLYEKARSGKIKNFTGIDSPYERPVNPDITIKTNEVSVEDALTHLLELVLPRVNRT